MLLADEVEDREAAFPRQAQAAAELLQEDGGALGRPQEEDRVDLGDVDALVEQVDGEEDVDLAVARRLARALVAVSAAVSAETATRGDAWLR